MTSKAVTWCSCIHSRCTPRRRVCWVSPGHHEPGAARADELQPAGRAGFSPGGTRGSARVGRRSPRFRSRRAAGEPGARAGAQAAGAQAAGAQAAGAGGRTP
jgi:hypothetical protein